MERLTIRVDNGLEEIYFYNPDDPEGEYTLSDIAKNGHDDICDQIANRLATYEDTGLTPEQIQAQRQEIDQLKNQNDTLSDTVNMFAPYIIGKKEAEVVEDLKELLTLKQQNAVLTADKDEQAGRIMRLENLLRRIRPILRTSDIYRHALAAIDALLGGKEDEK